MDRIFNLEYQSILVHENSLYFITADKLKYDFVSKYKLIY